MIKMKITLVISTLILPLALQAQTFRIEGVLPDNVGAKEVKLFIPINREQGETVKIVDVREGKFIIDGVQDSAVVATLEYVSQKSVPVKRTLVLEQGVINADLKTGRVTGTVNNDTLQAIIDKRSDVAVVEAIHRHKDDVIGLLLTFDHLRFSSADKLEDAVRTIEPYFGEHPLLLLEKAFLNGIDKTGIGDRFIDFVQKDKDGLEHRFSDIVKQNRYTIVDFWASWCGPCCREMPEVIAIYEKYKDKGVGAVGVSWDRDRKAWLAGIERLNIPWLQLCDLKGRENEATVAWGVRSIPSLWVIDSNGIIVEKLLRGPAAIKKLEDLFDKIK